MSKTVMFSSEKAETASSQASGFSALLATAREERRDALIPALAELGLQMLPAADGVEALRLVDRARPVLLLLDAELEVLDGFTVCARLRKEDANQAVPIIILGPGDDREGRLEALKCGADDFISTPVDPLELQLRIKALLRPLGMSPLGPVLPARAADLPREGAAEAGSQELYATLIALVNRVLEQVRLGETVELAELSTAADRLAGQREDFSELVALALGKREVSDLAAHHVNVAIIGLAVARELDLSEEDLEKFALLALVHDLGMVKLIESVIESPAKLSPQQFQAVTQHPRDTYDLLLAAGAEYEEIAEIAWQEHEREKGQGYPRGLKGKEIHELAKIIGVADVYEACSHPRSYDKTHILYDALQEVIEMKGEFFASRYVKALMNALTVYPTGGYVQLNTGEIGRVRATNRENLLRPVVEIFWSRQQRLSPTKTVNLLETPFLFISKALSEDQLPSA